MQTTGITAEDAANRAREMFNLYLNSGNDGECGDMACCGEQLVLKRIDPVSGNGQISTDGGETWMPDPSSVANQINLLPPLVTEGGSSTKCDAATNASQHINDLIDSIHTNLSTAVTIFDLAVAIAEAALLLFVLFVTGGTASPVVLGLATAIWAGANGVFALGIEAYDAYWSSDKKDVFLCACYCNIGDDGQFTEAQYQAFRTYVKTTLPASPAFDIVMTTINAGGARGLSQMASYGNAADADCSSCACDCMNMCETEFTFYGVHDVVFDGCNVYTMKADGGSSHVAFSSGDQANGCYWDAPLFFTTGSIWPVGSASPVGGTNPKVTRVWNFDIGGVAAEEPLTFAFSSAPIT